MLRQKAVFGEFLIYAGGRAQAEHIVGADGFDVVGPRVKQRDVRAENRPETYIRAHHNSLFSQDHGSLRSCADTTSTLECSPVIQNGYPSLDTRRGYVA